MTVATGSPSIEVRASPVHGRGVYATRSVPAGEVMVEAHALLLEPDDTDALAGHLLASYLVAWDEHRTAVPFGPLSFVNHDDAPNAELVVDHDRTMVLLVTTARVAAGSEVTVDYGEDHPI